MRLEVLLEAKIVNPELYPGTKGKTLSIDLKVVHGGEHIDLCSIKEAVESFLLQVVIITNCEHVCEIN